MAKKILDNLESMSIIGLLAIILVILAIFVGYSSPVEHASENRTPCGADSCGRNEQCAIVNDGKPRCYTSCTKQSDCANGETCVSMDSLTPINALVNPKLNQTHFLCVQNN
jgi:biopolymer transport protein ExbD